MEGNRPTAHDLVSKLDASATSEAPLALAVSWLDKPAPLDRPLERVKVAASLGIALARTLKGPADPTPAVKQHADTLVKIQTRPGEPPDVRLAIAAIFGEALPAAIEAGGLAEARVESLTKACYDILEKGLGCKETFGRMASVYGLTRLARIALAEEIQERVYEHSLNEEDDQAAEFTDQAHTSLLEKTFHLSLAVFHPA